MSSNEHKYNTKNLFKKRLINVFLNNTKDLINKLAFDSIMDFGCGEGYVLHYLSKNIDFGNKKILGIDYSESAINSARELNKNFDFLIENEKYLDSVSDNSFDVVICFEVLEHLEEPQTVLKKLYNVSNKYLIVSVPNEPLFTILRFLSFNNWLRFGRHPEHVNFWNINSFYKFIEENIHPKKITIKISNTWIIAVIQK